MKDTYADAIRALFQLATNVEGGRISTIGEALFVRSIHRMK